MRIPSQLWMLWNGDDSNGNWVLAIDGAGDCYMTFLDEMTAVLEASRQNDMYDLDCKAVRVK